MLQTIWSDVESVWGRQTVSVSHSRLPLGSGVNKLLVVIFCEFYNRFLEGSAYSFLCSYIEVEVSSRRALTANRSMNNCVMTRSLSVNLLRIQVLIFWRVGVCAWLIDGVLDSIYSHLIHSTRNYRKLQRYRYSHSLQFTVTHALGFSVFTSRILATDLQQSHCHFKSHMKSYFHSLIPFLPLFCNC
jgi:hypothetical protein